MCINDYIENESITTLLEAVGWRILWYQLILFGHERCIFPYRKNFIFLSIFELFRSCFSIYLFARGGFRLECILSRN